MQKPATQLIGSGIHREHRHGIGHPRGQRGHRDVDSKSQSQQRTGQCMSREGHESNEQTDRKCRHDGFASNTPQPVIVQQMPERRHEPLLAELVAFEREFPEKAPWHLVLIRF